MERKSKMQPSTPSPSFCLYVFASKVEGHTRGFASVAYLPSAL
jgi:hypothetical protein